MEPFSALAVATSLVQFLDFTGKLISSTYRIHRSSRDSDGHNDIKTITKSLTGLNDDLTKSLSQSTAFTPFTATRDQELNTLCQESSIYAYLSFSTLREQMASVQASSSRTQGQTDSILQITQDLSQRLLGRIDQNNKLQADIINAINRNHMQVPADTSARLPGNTMLQFLNSNDEVRLCRRLLHKLQFQEIENHYESIPEAHKETFKWIFDETPSGHNWTNFKDWLGNDESLHWITGKPGAGKSTLMKFIFDNPRMKLLLNDWSHGHKLIVSSFYFWNSGQEIQMSHNGLVRTLLHNVLQQLPELLPRVFPHILEAWMMFGDYSSSNYEWTGPELRRALQRLVRVTDSSSIRTVFFIDGLDEFHGNPSDLIEFIQGLLSPNVKICVSSRPWVVFEDAFRNRPSLRIEDLTHGDIKLYLTAKLITDITDKASGVFLWVYLVSGSLLSGLSDGERLSDLQRRLDSLPADLGKLFQKILGSLDPSHFERASQLFQIERAALAPLTLLSFSFADDDDSEAVFKFPSRPLTSQEETARAEMMRRRLNACCKGMLELQGTPRLPLASVPVVFVLKKVFDSSMQISPSFVGLTEDLTFALEYAVRAYPSGSNFQFRILDEIGKTMSQMGSARKNNKSAIPASLDQGAGYPASYSFWFGKPSPSIDSFLELAVQLQLCPYVEHCLNRSSSRTIDLTKLLYIAVAGYDITFEEIPSISQKHRNYDLIKTFLRLGADPNASVSIKYTIWQLIGRSPVTASSDIVEAFLEHGADPVRLIPATL
ncbi:hypothetical protein AJ79_03410 [Helicocarpus griseus UAMH5409]|uniref:Uncharacterized protein n=1 Tax=Helicocarpus griseus UAMH5409 TaxID=1447875 RepID=A0A2B7XYY8_9EURO|nr:hypothetical protein AJ79_03410 [Helicocarpus griseus UAMH5409]